MTSTSIFALVALISNIIAVSSISPRKAEWEEFKNYYNDPNHAQEFVWDLEFLDMFWKHVKPEDLPFRNIAVWDPDEEKSRFISTMLSKEWTEEKAKYVSLVFNHGEETYQNVFKNTEIYGMSESLEFIIYYYTSAMRAEDQSLVSGNLLDDATKQIIPLLPSTSEVTEFIADILNKGKQLMEKYSECEKGSEIRRTLFAQLKNLYENSVSGNSTEFKKYANNVKLQADLFTVQNELFDSARAAEKEVYEILQKLNEIDEVYKKHVHNALQHTMEKQPEPVTPAMAQLPMLEEIDLELFEVLQELYENVEGIRNTLLTEKDEENQKLIVQDLQHGEDEISDLAGTLDAFRQVFSVLSVTNGIISRTYDNKKVSLSKFQTYQKYTTKFAALMEERLAVQVEFNKFSEKLGKLLEDDENEINQSSLKEEL